MSLQIPLKKVGVLKSHEAHVVTNDVVWSSAVSI